MFDDQRIEQLDHLIEDNSSRSNNFEKLELFSELSEFFVPEDGPIQVPESLAVYLALSFGLIANGISADESFNLKYRGRPKDPMTGIRNLIIAHDVTSLMEQGNSLETSCFKLSQKLNISDNTIEKIYKTNNVLAEMVLDKDGNLTPLAVAYNPNIHSLWQEFQQKEDQ